MDTTVRNIIVYDLETGGLPNKSKKAFYDVPIAEAAFVVVDAVNLVIVEEWSTLVKPYKDGLNYEPQALSVNGLTMEQIQNNGIDCKDLYNYMKALMKKYKNPRIGAILAGHNIKMFDIPFIENMFEFYKDDLYEYVTFIEDTMKLGWYRSVEQENYKLGTCCRREGVDLVDAHRALADTKANALLLIKYLQQFRGIGASGEAVAAPVVGMKPSSFRETFQLA